MNKCTSCGGNIVFNPKTQALCCEQCGALYAIKSTITTEKSFAELLKNVPQWQNDTIVYCCEQCGAKTVIAKSDLTVKCEYCGAQSLNQVSDMPGLRPDTIVTFRITKEKALENAQQWLLKRLFTPSGYRRQVNAKNLNGVYCPVFTFDAQANSVYRGVEEVPETYIKMVDGRPMNLTRTRRVPIVGRISQDFDEITISASTELTAQMLYNLQPFSTNDAQNYNKDYLLGYHIKTSTKDAIQCWEEAQKTIYSVIYNKIISRYSNHVTDLDISTNLTNVTYKYALLPLYTGYSEYKGKQYELFVNGQTGKVTGKTPKSPWKFLFWAATALAVVGGIIALAMLL